MPRKRTVEQQLSVARLNAMKHGFARRLPIIPGIEDEAGWKRHLKGITRTFNPEGYFEEFLVRRLATVLWDVDRLTAYQVASTMREIAGTAGWMGIAANYLSGTDEIVQPDPDSVHERQQGQLLPGNNDLEIIMRYGSMLHRQWIQIHNQLLATQARRRGEKVPVAMLDVRGPPPNIGPFRSSPTIPASLSNGA
jgi:hypothetical protein